MERHGRNRAVAFSTSPEQLNRGLTKIDSTQPQTECAVDQEWRVLYVICGGGYGLVGRYSQKLEIDSNHATEQRSALIECSDNWAMGAADARCHLMTCCANGEGEAEAGDDDRPLALRACYG